MGPADWRSAECLGQQVCQLTIFEFLEKSILNFSSIFPLEYRGMRLLIAAT